MRWEGIPTLLPGCRGIRAVLKQLEMDFLSREIIGNREQGWELFPSSPSAPEQREVFINKSK